MSDALPLPQLEDIVLPPAVPFWPPAPGWWVLAALLLIALIMAAVFGWRRWQRERWRREALRRLNELTQQPDAAITLRGLRELVKRVARLRYPQRGTDGLSGEAWLSFLGQTGPVRIEQWRPLIESAWKPAQHPELPPLTELVRAWLKAQP